MSDDFPAFGKPTSPASATVFSSSSSLKLRTGLAAQREPGRLALGGGERGVAQAAAAALGGDEPRPGADQVGENLAIGSLDHGPVGHTHDQVSALGAAPVGSGSGLAAARPPQRPAVEVEQRRRAGIDLDDHIAAAAAVTAVRAAERLELLPVDGRAAVAAVACLHPQLGLVSELGHGIPLS